MPGIILFYENVAPIIGSEDLPDREKVLLIAAMLQYGCKGIETPPELSKIDSSCGRIAWEFLKIGLERSQEYYESGVNKHKYAVFCREYDKYFTTGKPTREDFIEKPVHYWQIVNEAKEQLKEKD